MQFNFNVPKPKDQGPPVSFSMTGVNVMLAMPTHRDLSPGTVASLLATQDALWRQGVLFNLEIQAGSSLPHQARIKVAWHFLQSQCTHLFWVDSDIVWRASDFLRLLAFGTKLECVGALYPAKIDPPTIFINVDDMEAEVVTNEYGCLPVKGMGLGFTVIQRKVVEELAAKAPLCRVPYVDGRVPYLFRCDMDGAGNLRGEDMAFFNDIIDLGYRVWFDPSVQLGHVGPKEYRADPRDFLTMTEGI